VFPSPRDPSAQDVPDVIGADLAVLFCGINPGQASGSLGQHFARPGNRFWKVLYEAGFTDRTLAPAEQRLLLDYRLGVTNLVDRTTRAGADARPAELAEGARRLAEKVERWKPAWVAVLGMVAYRRAFGQPRATIGRQTGTMHGAGIWLLPNPSGLQARYQLPDMVDMFAELRASAFGRPPS
jgi:TDG/mug DNA glycosylase family protein